MGSKNKVTVVKADNTVLLKDDVSSNVAVETLSMPEMAKSLDKGITLKSSGINLMSSGASVDTENSFTKDIGFDIPESNATITIKSNKGIDPLGDVVILTKEEQAAASGGWALYWSRYAEDNVKIVDTRNIVVDGEHKRVPAVIVQFSDNYYRCPLAWKTHVKVLDNKCRMLPDRLRKIPTGSSEFMAKTFMPAK